MLFVFAFLVKFGFICCCCCRY